MSTLAVRDKIDQLSDMQSHIHAQLMELFPVGSEIRWRTENSFSQDGSVVEYRFYGGEMHIRVTDGMFHSNITLADVLRA